MAQAMAYPVTRKCRDDTVDEGSVPVIRIGGKSQGPCRSIRICSGIFAQDGLKRMVIIYDGNLTIGITAFADFVTGAYHFDGEVLVSREHTGKIGYAHLDALFALSRIETDDGGLVVLYFVVDASLSVGDGDTSGLIYFFSVSGIESKGKCNIGNSFDRDIYNSGIFINGERGRGEVNERYIRKLHFAAAGSRCKHKQRGCNKIKLLHTLSPFILYRNRDSV